MQCICRVIENGTFFSISYNSFLGISGKEEENGNGIFDIRRVLDLKRTGTTDTGNN
jgi:hypothetical protein